jgi:LysM repeat protein
MKRYELFLLFVVASLILSSGSNAQDGWATTEDESYYTSSSTETAPPASSEQDATYVIKKGDTLWDLAFQFLGDPFSWQRIWQLNSYIANPDLIFPGNSLIIPDRYAESATANTTSDTDYADNAAAPFDSEDSFSSETQAALDENAALQDELTDTSGAYPGDSQLIHIMKLKNILSEGWLSIIPFLWTKKDQRGHMYPGNGEVEKPEKGQAYQLFQDIAIDLFDDVVYNIGDTIDIFTSLRFVRFNGKPANLVKRVGKAYVRKVEDDNVLALLFEMSDVIVGKERTAPSTPFIAQTIDSLIDPQVAITASVFTRVEETASPYPFQMIILDKGNMQGVQLGDVFGIYHKDDDDIPARLSMVGMVGNVGESSSTLNIVIMSNNAVSEGDRAILLRRAQLSQQEE